MLVQVRCFPPRSRAVDIISNRFRKYDSEHGPKHQIFLFLLAFAFLHILFGAITYTLINYVSLLIVSLIRLSFNAKLKQYITGLETFYIVFLVFFICVYNDQLERQCQATGRLLLYNNKTIIN